MVGPTNHFESKAKALHYYSGYGYRSDLFAAVTTKIASGEIVIGAPEVSEGYTATVGPEGRYIITKE